MNLQGIVEQLESCNYECEAGSLVNNVAFQELKRRAADKTKSSDLHAALGDELYVLAKEADWIDKGMSEVEFKTAYAEPLQNAMNRVMDRLQL